MMKACSLATHLPIEQAKFVSQPLNSCSACGLSINFFISGDPLFMVVDIEIEPKKKYSLFPVLLHACKNNVGNEVMFDCKWLDKVELVRRRAHTISLLMVLESVCRDWS